jgi:predicted nucleotidyltransferase
MPLRKSRTRIDARRGRSRRNKIRHFEVLDASAILTRVTPERCLPAETERVLATAARDWAAVELLVLFGSSATGRLTEHSDVDLLVRLDHGHAVDPSEREQFIAAAARACRREIDLVIEQPTTSVILRREVAAEGRPLFERTPGAFRYFVVDAVRAYVDLEPQLRKIGTAIRARAVEAGRIARINLARRESGNGR